MNRARWLPVLASTILFVFPAVLLAQPPPPPPPGFPDYVHLLDEAYNSRDLKAYANLFRQDVHVYVQGKLVASSRNELIARVRSEFEGNLHLRTLSWAQGGQILTMEEVIGCIPVQPDPNTVYHGCYKARAVRYDLADNHQIEAVYILEANNAWNMHAG